MREFQKLFRIAGAFVASVALGGVLMSAAVPLARADDDHDKCRHRIEKAEHRLDQAVHKYGEHSEAAERRRHELNEEREHCWGQYHGYWNGADRRWHDQRDWEEHHEDQH